MLHLSAENFAHHKVVRISPILKSLGNLKDLVERGRGGRIFSEVGNIYIKKWALKKYIIHRFLLDTLMYHSILKECCSPVASSHK